MIATLDKSNWGEARRDELAEKAMPEFSKQPIAHHRDETQPIDGLAMSSGS